MWKGERGDQMEEGRVTKWEGSRAREQKGNLGSRLRRGKGSACLRHSQGKQEDPATHTIQQANWNLMFPFLTQGAGKHEQCLKAAGP